VSRPKRRLTVIIDGVAHQVVEKVQRPPSLVSTAPPRSHWLVQAYDPAEHLVALVVANVPADCRSPGAQPLVYTMPTGSPSHVLLPEAFDGAFCSGLDGEEPRVTPMGVPRAQIPVFCTVCRAEFDLKASDVQTARGPKPGEPGAFTVGVSDSAEVGQR
jgi:hypothetical protein